MKFKFKKNYFSNLQRSRDWPKGRWNGDTDQAIRQKLKVW